MLKRTPKLLWQSLTEADKIVGALTFAAVAFGFGAVREWLPWWAPLATLAVLLLYGFLKENYEEYSKADTERANLQKGVETAEKRAAIGAGLQQLYEQGATLRIELVNSTDETTVEESREKLRAWAQSVLDYVDENVSRGKAQYVDGVTSVSAASISGMKSVSTRREKETIVLHLQERLKRLAEVMKDY